MKRHIVFLTIGLVTWAGILGGVVSASNCEKAWLESEGYTQKVNASGLVSYTSPKRRLPIKHEEVPFGLQSPDGVVAPSSRYVVTISRKPKQHEVILLSGVDRPRGPALVPQFYSASVGEVTKNNYVRDPLHASNVFALKRMLEKRVITKAQFDYYQKVLAELDPRQVTSVEVHELDLSGMLVWRLRNEPDAFEDVSIWNFPAVAVGNSLMQNAVWFPASRLSNLWLISGQVERATVQKKLPWQVEFPLLAQKFHSKFCWELGRAAALKPDVFEYNVGILTSIAFAEVVHAGGNLADATMTAHATTKRNSDYFKTFGFNSVPGQTPNSKEFHEILEIPLLELLKKYPPSRYFASIQTLTDALNLPGMSIETEVKAARLLAKGAEIRMRQPSMYENDPIYEGPVMVQDLSGAMTKKFEEIGKAEGLADWNLKKSIEHLGKQVFPIDDTGFEDHSALELNIKTRKMPGQNRVIISGRPKDGYENTLPRLPHRLKSARAQEMVRSHIKILLSVLADYMNTHKLSLEEMTQLETKFTFLYRGWLHYRIGAFALTGAMLEVSGSAHRAHPHPASFLGRRLVELAKKHPLEFKVAMERPALIPNPPLEF